MITKKQKALLPVLGGAMLCTASFSVLSGDFQALDEAYQGIAESNVVSQISNYAPVFDFDGDSCLPSAAISRNGSKNGGLKTSGSQTGDCRSSNFLDLSNTYHRWVSKSSNGSVYTAHVYDLYFEKDQTSFGFLGGGADGHRHDVETVIMYFTNNTPTHMAVSAHGDYTLKAWGDVDKVGTHPKVVYHQEGGLTHAFRFASDSTAENPYGQWVTPAIVSWYEMLGDGISNTAMRTNINDFDYGSASFKFKDGSFTRTINKSDALPAGYPGFTSDHGNEVAGSWSSSSGRSTTGAGNLVYKLDVPSTMTITIDLTSSVDAYMYLLNSDGSTLVFNDDGGDGYNSRISRELTPGTYQVVAATYDSGQSGSFALKSNGGLLSIDLPTIKVALLGAHNKYFVAENGGGDAINANRSSAGAWEKFDMSALKNSSHCVKHGDKVTLKTRDSYYWSAQSDGDLNSDKTSVGSWETFTLTNHSDASGCLANNDQISLKSTHNKYVVAESNGAANADRSGIGSWEKFSTKFQ